MSDKTVTLTSEERSALESALDYYIDTLTECTAHEDGQHGNEDDCEGWGPRELEVLKRAADKVTT